jgi:hypothetical protein
MQAAYPTRKRPVQMLLRRSDRHQGYEPTRPCRPHGSRMKFVEPSSFIDPDVAARKLMKIANSVEPVQDGRIHIEKINCRSYTRRAARRLGDRARLALAARIRGASLDQQFGVAIDLSGPTGLQGHRRSPARECRQPLWRRSQLTRGARLRRLNRSVWSRCRRDMSEGAWQQRSLRVRQTHSRGAGAN